MPEQNEIFSYAQILLILIVTNVFLNLIVPFTSLSFIPLSEEMRDKKRLVSYKLDITVSIIIEYLNASIIVLKCNANRIGIYLHRINTLMNFLLTNYDIFSYRKLEVEKCDPNKKKRLLINFLTKVCSVKLNNKVFPITDYFLDVGKTFWKIRRNSSVADTF